MIKLTTILDVTHIEACNGGNDQSEIAKEVLIIIEERKLTFNKYCDFKAFECELIAQACHNLEWHSVPDSIALEPEFDTTHTIFSAIKLDLGNNFTDEHFFKEIKKHCYLGSDLADLFDKLRLNDLDDNYNLTFDGNCGSVGGSYVGYDLFALLGYK